MDNLQLASAASQPHQRPSRNYPTASPNLDFRLPVAINASEAGSGLAAMIFGGRSLEDFKSLDVNAYLIGIKARVRIR
jgi:hypothetical protein